MNRIRVWGLQAFLGAIVALALSLGCGANSDSGPVLFVDAEYDPVGAFNTSTPIHEASQSVAQTFTVLASGRLEKFQIVLTQGAAGEEGTVTISIRPIVGGLPEADDTNSLITPIVVDTTTLPAANVEEFTVFEVGDEPGRDVVAGDQFAIVAKFTSRTLGTANMPIATLLGRTGDEYAGGTGTVDLTGAGFVDNTNDYFFRTFVLR